MPACWSSARHWRPQLNRAQAFGEPVRALVDRKPGRAIDKRWTWIKRGVPLICDIGARDVASGNVTYIRRDQLRNGEKIQSQAVPQQQFVAEVSALLGSIHSALHEAAQQRLAGQYPHRHHKLRGTDRVLHRPPRRISAAGCARLVASGG